MTLKGFEERHLKEYDYYILTEQHQPKMEKVIKTPLSLQRAKKAYYNRIVVDPEVRINFCNKSKNYYDRNKEEIAKRRKLKRDSLKDITNIKIQI